MTEDQLEQEALGWLADLGYAHLYGPDIAFDGPSPERKDYREVLLIQRLSNAIDRLNPAIPLSARQDALQQVISLGIPSQLSANRYFHQLLVTGVPVQYTKDGDTRGDFVRLKLPGCVFHGNPSLSGIHYTKCDRENQSTAAGAVSNGMTQGGWGVALRWSVQAYDFRCPHGF